MITTAETFKAWLRDREGRHLEFKEAKARYDIDELTRYCVALANERGLDRAANKELLFSTSSKEP